jgi:hypothetical protein
MKYAARVTKKEIVGGFSYPLNYMMHERLLRVYIDPTQSEGSNS